MIDGHQSPEENVEDNVPLIQKAPKKPSLPRCYSCLRAFGWTVSKEQREIWMSGRTLPRNFPSNLVKNTKYNPVTLIPIVLYNQFKFFFNLFFLIIALSQFIPALKVGFLFTYVAPLFFVLAVTIIKESIDDITRFKRDREINGTKYEKLTKEGTYKDTTSATIAVGDIIKIKHNQRIPADMILLYATDKSGAIFIRTDQLDGETDWKLRRPV
jgi:phospholipid-translocating ATPase